MNTPVKSQHRAEACLIIIKNAMKEADLRPDTVLRGLEEKNDAWPKVILQAASATMQVLRDEMREKGLKPSQVAGQAGVTVNEVKSWLTTGLMPYSWFMEICRSLGLKVDDVFAAANEKIITAKKNGDTPEFIPTPELVDKKTFTEWFHGGMPFAWFLLLSKVVKIKASEVFAKAKVFIKNERENTKIEETGPNGEPLAPATPEVKQEKHADPWISTEVVNPPFRDQSPVHPAPDPGDNTTGTEQPVSNGEESTEPGTDSPAKPNATAEPDPSPRHVQPSITLENEPAVKREIAPGVTEDDLKALDEEPYKFNYSGRDAGMDDASNVIMNWNKLKEDALNGHDGMTDSKRKALFASYPTPVKLTPTRVGLKFRNQKARDGFVDKGYMRELQEIINLSPWKTVILQQANFNELEDGKTSIPAGSDKTSGDE